jgi:hypothetical protein
VAIAVVLTIVAGLIFPGGALVIGLACAYIVWADDSRLKYRFAMLAGIFTLIWGLLLLTAASGIFDTVHAHQGTPSTVTAPK